MVDKKGIKFDTYILAIQLPIVTWLIYIQMLYGWWSVREENIKIVSDIWNCCVFNPNLTNTIEIKRYLSWILITPAYLLLQKESGTGITEVKYLATFSSWLSVDQLHIPEEQVSWKMAEL